MAIYQTCRHFYLLNLVIKNKNKKQEGLLASKNFGKKSIYTCNYFQEPVSIFMNNDKFILNVTVLPWPPNPGSTSEDSHIWEFLLDVITLKIVLHNLLVTL